MTKPFTDPAAAIQFALGGNATITLRSKRTQQRFTYKIKVSKDRDGKPNRHRFFVSWLNGPDNESNYAYLGMIDSRGFRLTQASHAGSDAPCALAFNYFYRQAIEKHRIPDELEVFHEGRCGCCGRKLTVPESIESGIGPECAKRYSLAA